jgi:hypothetical protein
MFFDPERRAALLTFGFLVTVDMWIWAYLGHLPGFLWPSWLILLLMLACLPLGGFLAARWSGGGVQKGAMVGLLASLLNLLILGSLLKEAGSWATLFLCGNLLLGVLLGGLGGFLSRDSGDWEAPDWNSGFTAVVSLSTFFLLVAGGLVTSKEAGLAVPDWPNSFGTNMFFYPLSKMSGGIFYEHSHRLLGSLVGLGCLVLALHLSASRVSSRLKRMAWFVFRVCWGACG